HDAPECVMLHARDASLPLPKIECNQPIFSSAMKNNTQYMHSLWFNMDLSKPTSKEKVMEKLRANRRIALTERRSANQIFSFGRDHGYYGRILSQAVIASATLAVRGEREIVGFCFTPQDGNSLASSIAAALWLMDPDRAALAAHMATLDRFFFREI